MMNKNLDTVERKRLKRLQKAKRIRIARNSRGKVMTSIWDFVASQVARSLTPRIGGRAKSRHTARKHKSLSLRSLKQRRAA